MDETAAMTRSPSDRNAPHRSVPPTFEIEQWVEASPAEVFEHFVIPEKLTRWHGVEAQIEAHPGGRWRCRFEDGSVVSGDILELDPPRRLVLTWSFEIGSPTRGLIAETPPGGSRVEVTFEPAGGGTRVLLRHQGFRPHDPVADGWRFFLRCLHSLLKY